MKTSIGYSSFSTIREEQDADLVKVTTSVLTFSNEKVGSGGDDINSTTLTSLFKGRLGSTMDQTELTSWSTSGVRGTNYDNMLQVVDKE